MANRVRFAIGVVVSLLAVAWQSSLDTRVVLAAPRGGAVVPLGWPGCTSRHWPLMVVLVGEGLGASATALASVALALAPPSVVPAPAVGSAVAG